MKKNIKNSLVLLILLVLIVLLALGGCKRQNMKNNDVNNKTYNTLNEEEKHVILDKGTEAPFTGKYTNNFNRGIYICKQCNHPLYKSTDKFQSNCGWPSFDDEIKGAVLRTPDKDGVRTEITCANCKGHLGHVFKDEKFTPKNTRHCVNSISIKLVETDDAIFSGGCFWGVQYYMNKLEGVVHTEVGYTGGHLDNPTYNQVCSGNTGHIESIRVYFDKEKTNYETVAKMFFEIHDPTQVNRQGPDAGEQYKSAVFYKDDEQKGIIDKLILQLEKKGYNIATEVKKAGVFWTAENYHQNYYEKKGGVPYCHKRNKIW